MVYRGDGGRPMLLALLLALLLFVGGAAAVARADSSYSVRAGDTLTAIASRHGVTVQALASANGLNWNSWVYVGQTLRIPDGRNGAPAPAPATSGSYRVQAGDTLFAIALRHGTTVQAIMAANGLSSTLIYAGQTLTIPGSSGSAAAAPAPAAPSSTLAYNPAPGEKWIDVNLTRQTITAYEGTTPLYSTTVSTGLPRTPTVTGTYRIYVKYVATDMQGGSSAVGDYYYLRDVPYTMYFYRGYGIHGTYWHNNFGQPMSHGCVNLRTPDAKWFFDWAVVGTPVVSHY